MSSLIFHTTENDIIVAMDTLAVSDSDGTPLLFTTKFYPVPHLNGVICGTGISSLICDWFVSVNAGMVVRDFLHLDHHTPCALRDLAALPKHQNLAAISTSTIYHLGFPADGSSPCVFAYRSERGFVSESLPFGRLAIKPEGDVPDPFELPKDFETMMLSQRSRESEKPKEKRVYIGGDIFVCHLNRSGFTTYRCASFPDKEEAMGVMLDRINYAKKNGAQPGTRAQ